MSQSWGATENTLLTPAGEQVYRAFEHTYARADATGVTVFASTGDGGRAKSGPTDRRSTRSRR